jgi:hypothetical protein
LGVVEGSERSFSHLADTGDAQGINDNRNSQACQPKTGMSKVHMYISVLEVSLVGMLTLCTRMFVAVLFVIVKNWKGLK